MKGKLKVENYAGALPVTDPIYGKGPYIYRNCENILVFFQTDASAAELLPEQLEFASDPPMACYLIGDYGFSSLGSYRESVLFFVVLFQGKPYLYAVNLFVNSEVPLAVGREVWGFPKKMADIEFKKQHNQVIATISRPSNNKIFTAIVSPETNLKQDDYQGYDVLTTKLIPNAEGTGPDVLQLVEIPFKATPIVGTDGIAELWRCKGSISYGSQSCDDPAYKVPVVNVVDAMYGRFNMHLPYGKVVYDYLKEK